LPAAANGRAQLLLNRGKLQLLGWPALRLDRAHLEFRDHDIDVIGFGLLHETDNQGKINLMGTVSPYSSDRPSKLAVRVDLFPIEGLIGTDLGQLIAGRVETETNTKSNFLDIPIEDGSHATLDLSLRNSPKSALNLRGFGFMNILSATLDDKWYRDPVFQNEIRCTIIRRGAEVTIKDLQLEEKLRMAVRGELRIMADRRLDGTLEVGIPGAIIQASGQSKFENAFGADELGYRWITLKISGIGNKPVDDFLTIIDASRPQGRATAPPDKVPTFEDLTTPE
jgi:hypothetical protein